MRTLQLATLGLSVALLLPLSGQAKEVSWGGPGFDHGKSGGKALTAALAAHGGLAIRVDVEQTVGDVGRMIVSPGDGLAIQSVECAKAERHGSAPWVCRFAAGKFVGKKGRAKLSVFDRAGRLRFATDAALEKLAALER